MPPPIRILLVEDDMTEARALEEECRAATADPAIRLVRNADDAMKFLRDDEFDLIVCDLALPADAGTIHPERDHGLETFRTSQRECAGTPVIVLSGHLDIKVAQELARACRQVDLFGIGINVPMVQFFEKQNFPECLHEIKELLGRASTLVKFPLIPGPGLNLTASEARVMQIFGRRYGSEIHVSKLSGGKSGAKTLRAEVLEPDGTRRAQVAAKLGRRERVLHESVRYKQIESILPVGLGAPLLCVIEAGAGRSGGAFYRLANEHTQTLFDSLQSSPSDALEILQKLRHGFEDFYSSACTANQPVREIRRDFISDVDLHNMSFDVAFVKEVDVVEVEASVCFQHGDLHGMNILVNKSNDAVVIDYADVRRSSPTVDPITLELSTIFHPAGESTRGDWPSADQADAWADIDVFTEGCPFAEFVKECRAWTSSVATSDSEIAAVVMGYTLRQLKYNNPTKHLALRMAQVAASALLAPE